MPTSLLRIRQRWAIYASLLLLTQCSKCKHDDPAPIDSLPAATQTGADTFGFLLNGQPWTPNGYRGTPNYRVSYDPGYHGGVLQVQVYRFLGNTGKSQFLVFGHDSVSKARTYQFTTQNPRARYESSTLSYLDDSKTAPCDQYDTHPGTTTIGQLTITRLDLQKGIISGTFSFLLTQPGCDTIRITVGRFDRTL